MRGGVVERKNDIGVLRYSRDQGHDAQTERDPVVDRSGTRLEPQAPQMLRHRAGPRQRRDEQMPALRHVFGLRGGKDIGPASEADRHAAILGTRPQVSAKRVDINHDGGIRMSDACRERTHGIDRATGEQPEYSRRS